MSGRRVVGAASLSAVPFLVALFFAEPWPFASDSERISTLGRYQGYSQPKYGGWRRRSQYVEVRDGTRLAVDIYVPTRWGFVASEPLPVLWTHARYHRARIENGQLQDPVQHMARYQKFLKHGYVLVFVDARGSGSSFGRSAGPFSEPERNDTYDVTEWLASQPWSNGRVGMFGTSYMGIAQYLAASTAPPSLRAIFPQKAMFDLYDFGRPGGILREDFGRQWSDMVERLDNKIPSPPVSDDPKGELLAAARREHLGNRTAYGLFEGILYRDSPDRESDERVYLTRSPSTYLSDINASGVAVYHLGGWFDLWPRDTLLWFANLKVPQKVVIGPWTHIGTEAFDNFAEHLRWYDYWLKGVDNGVMEEPAIHYYTMGAPEGAAWRSTDVWPLPGEERVNFYFCAGDPDDSGPAARGALCWERQKQPGKDTYEVDLTATTGPHTRWSNGYGRPMDYGDLSRNDAKGISYTSTPLDREIEVTGHPVVRIWLASAGYDVDLIAYLEEVDLAGRSSYVTEGALKASHRALADPPYDRIGLPYHPSFAADIQTPPVEPAELVFDLHPTSKIFFAGSRIRITLTGADQDNLVRQPTNAERPRIQILYGPDFPSAINIPVIPDRETLGSAPNTPQDLAE